MEPSLPRSVEAIQALGVGNALRDRIAELERALAGSDRDQAASHVANNGIGSDALLAALTIKAMAGQINVVVHALGILVSLPYVLDEGEVIELLSLGAGSTGKPHDLVTDRRIAEFKFITWRGGADTIRQNSLFVDLFNLATSDSDKRRQMYVLGTDVPLRFLTGKRSITSVLSKHAPVMARFKHRHGADGIATVGQYWASIQNRVELIDLQRLVPVFNPATAAQIEAANLGPDRS